MLRSRSMFRTTAASVLGLCVCAGLVARPLGAQAPKAATQPAAKPATAAQEANVDKDPAHDEAVERTRKMVRMLDGIYKNAIVLVTANFVSEKSDMPAGVAFKKLFEVAKKEGWHEVRLLDATGDPYEPENVAKTDFEKRAIKELLAGKTYVDKVVEKDGKRYLQAATAIPVVMDKCVMCHDHYKDVPKGQAIGALGYVVPIE